MKFPDFMRLPQSEVHFGGQPLHKDVEHGPLHYQYEAIPPQSQRPLMRSPPELSIPLHIGLCGSCSKLYHPDVSRKYELLVNNQKQTQDAEL